MVGQRYLVLLVGKRKESMNTKYLNNVQAFAKLHMEYAITGMSYETYKDLVADTFRRTKYKKMSEKYRNHLWKKYKEIKEWEDKILVEWPEKYHDYVFSGNKLPNTGKFRHKLDKIYLYLFERTSREHAKT